MNTESVDCRRIKVPVESEVKILPGDSAWDFDSPETQGDRNRLTHFIYLALPGNGGGWSAIEVQKGSPGGPRIWGWDGNEDKPTLTPSINAPGQWHGFLTNGRLVSC